MSLNRTLTRLLVEIRREAKRNPDFAARLDAVLRLHESRRDAPDALIAEIAGDVTSSAPEPPLPAPLAAAPALNPVGLFKRAGEPALVAALAGLREDQLAGLVAEHNLDPAGAAAKLDRDGLAAHILAQAKRRAERDEKMFDY